MARTEHSHFLVLGEHGQMLQAIFHGVLPENGWAGQQQERHGQRGGFIHFVSLSVDVDNPY